MGKRRKIYNNGLFCVCMLGYLLLGATGAKAATLCSARVSRLGTEIYAQMTDLVEVKVGQVNGKPVAKLRLKDVLDTYQYEGTYLKPGRIFGLRGYVTSFNSSTRKAERHHVATLIATVDGAKRISWAVRLAGQNPIQLSGRDDQVTCGMSGELSSLFREIEHQGSEIFNVQDVDVNSPRLLAHVLGQQS